ncbi:unnamed protein product [Rotaria socialis]|uniref:DDE Tnp4 domain-containing protein n=1 Tax=Rotaria socialis TaxID=392032 RepID=A0A820WE82_9BILA|nr:unnamed protein product [Rotaria socialis]CAF4514501.1 unnamed protein product [Rotaria socialis]
MSEVFVPLYIGSQAFQRHDIIHVHSPESVKVLLPNVVAMIYSTYVYVQKSWNFNNQKKSYCQHKADNLVKVMAIVLLDGKWFDIYGPYFSDGYNNDELIWNTLSDDKVEDYENKDLFAHSQQLHAIFSKNGMFIGDRGFVRCKGEWSLYTPDSICKGEAQLSTIKANQTRFITRVRNAIERGFVRLKQWNFIGSVVNTDIIPVIGSIMRILCTVGNAYFSNLVLDNNDALEHAQYTIRNIQLENEVEHMEANTTGWKKANINDISSIITSYDENDVKQCNEWPTYIHPDFPSTVKIKNNISRYKTTDNPKKHTVWIRFGHNKLDDIAFYCTCKSGLRTASGTCTYVTAVLIALIHWKSNKKRPSFYTTAAALFLNALDCTTYKESKMKQESEEYSGASSDTKNQTTSISQGTASTDTEVTDEECTSSEISDEDSMDSQTADLKFTSSETSDEDARYELYTDETK